MARTSGAKAKDHDAKRADLLEKIGAHLRKNLPHRPGLREMAAAADVTIPTLKHYFSTRDGIITAYFEHFGRQGASHLAIVAEASESFEASIETLVSYVLGGLFYARVIEGHAAGLSEAVGSTTLGPNYLLQLLEPTLQAVEQRLQAHQCNGEMRQCDLRIAALALIAPLYLAALHQTVLGGCIVRPMDVQGLASEITGSFIRAYRV